MLSRGPTALRTHVVVRPGPESPEYLWIEPRMRYPPRPTIPADAAKRTPKSISWPAIVMESLKCSLASVATDWARMGCGRRKRVANDRQKFLSYDHLQYASYIAKVAGW